MPASRSTHKSSEATGAVSAVTVWLFSPAAGDFVGVPARRSEADVYELEEAPDGHDMHAGDLVRCELSDGELIVQERVWRQRMF